MRSRTKSSRRHAPVARFASPAADIPSHRWSRPTATLLSLERWHGVETTYAATCQATIRAGSKIASLGDDLRAHGMALANQGDVDVQALAGALATGTHGTGAKLASLSSQVARAAPGD